MMAGNNPYRSHPAALSGLGVFLSNGLTGWLIFKFFDHVDLYDTGDKVTTYNWYYQIALSLILQLAVDAAYLLHFCLWPVLGKDTFQNMRNKAYSAYIHRILDQAPGHELINKFGDCTRVLFRIAYSAENPAAVSAKEVKQLLASAAEKSSDCFIVVSVTPTEAQARDRSCAKKLGIRSQEVSVVQAEVIIARLCFTQQDETMRWSLYEKEIKRALEGNLIKDGLRLKAEQASLARPAPRTCIHDAHIFSEGLRSELFRQAVEDGLDQVYWGSVSTGLREYVRLEGNARADRSQTETRTLFRAKASSLGMPGADITVICSISEGELRMALDNLNSVELTESDVVVGQYRSLARRILEEKRLILSQLVVQADFNSWLKTDSTSDHDLLNGTRRGASNEFSLAMSCLDAFHFEHFKEHINVSMHRRTTSSKKMFEILKSRVIKDGLVDIGNKLCVLGVSELSMTTCAEDEPEDPGNASNVTFLPSILFICVGIAVIITSLLFANTLSNSISYRNLLNEAVNIVSNIQSFAGEFSVAVLDLMLCVDPNIIQTLRTLTPQQYANDLKTWPPLVNAISQVSNDPALNIAGIERAVVQTLTSGIDGVMVQVASVAVTTMMNSLQNGTSVAAAGVSAAAAAKQATGAAVSQLVATITTNPVLSSYKSTLPGILTAAIEMQLLNLTQPAVISTLPVFGPTLICLGNVLSAPAVASVINQGINYIESQKIPKISLLNASALDPCRESLEIYDCAIHWKNVYPTIQKQRNDLYQLSKMQGDTSDVVYHVMNESAQPYSSTTVPEFCQTYESEGCVAVLSALYQSRSTGEWVQFVNTTRDLINSYLTPLNDTINYVTYYADERMMPCFLTGHVTAFFSAIIITCNVLVQFNRRIIEMRQGKNPYHGVFEKTDPATFSSTSTPTLGGMVVATAFAQYYVSHAPAL